MTLQPLLAASIWIQIHALMALAAFGLGLVQLARPKGGTLHRAIGYAWATVMVIVAASSFRIHEIDQWRGFSLIHLLSIQVLATLPMLILAVRRGDVARHRKGMIAMFFGALVVAGLFTLLPGRIMHAMVFGG